MQEGCRGAWQASVACGPDPGCIWVDMPPLGEFLGSMGLGLPVSTRSVALAELCWTPINLWLLLLRHLCCQAIVPGCLRQMLGEPSVQQLVDQGGCQAARHFEVLEARACRCQQQGSTAATLLPPVSSTELPARRA